MCLITFAWNVHPQWPLVLAANRDEFHARPTAALARWDDAPQIAGGRDLREGGGWLALDAHARRLAAVTNFREPPPPHGLRSRGALISGFLRAPECAAGFAAQLDAESPAYGPFNLLLWDGAELLYASNRPMPRWESVPSGLHGLSNGSLETHWPKVQRVTAALGDWLSQLPTQSSVLPALPALEPLFAALADERRAADAELPQTGVGLELERMLSPPFIRGDAYGTRASSVVLIGREQTLFVERRFGPNGSALGETALALP